MKILGNRVLVSKIEEEKKEGLQTVEVQDSFVNKGRVEQIGPAMEIVGNVDITPFGPSGRIKHSVLVETKVGDAVLFAKYSPDTQEVDLGDGRKMKIVRVEDILAVL